LSAPRAVDQARRRLVRSILFGSAALAVVAAGAVVLSKVPRVEGMAHPSAAVVSSSAPAQPSGAGEIGVRVVYFGMPPTVTGTKKESLQLASPAYLSNLEDALTLMHPGLKGMFRSMLILVDGVSANGNPQLKDDCEVDILAFGAGG